MTDWKNNLRDFATDKSRDRIDTPAVLFLNSTKDNKFGQIYLFSKFGKTNSNSLNMKSQLTVHYTEENCHLNDHWALEPIQYTISGLVGEVIHTPAKSWKNQAEKRVTNYLKPLEILSPSFDSYTQSALNLTAQIEENVIKYKELAKKALRSIGVGQNYRTSNQEYVITQLEVLRANRQLVSIYTPYGNYLDMAIVDINTNQDNSKYQSTLEITFQQWRDTLTVYRKATQKEVSQMVAVQGAPSTQLGQAGTTKREIRQNSTLKNLIDGVTK